MEYSTSEKIKRVASNKKMLLGLLAFVFVVAIVFVSSIFPLMLDPSSWLTPKFITNELIIVALTIISMVCFVFIGQSSNGVNPASELAKNRVKFFKSLELINPKISAFVQWVHQVQEPNDQRNKNARLLHSLGVENLSYLELDENELKTLMTQPYAKETSKGKKFFQTITKEQYKAIINIKRGKNAISFVAPESYLSLNKLDINMTISERLSNQNKKKTSTLSVSILSKVISVLIVGMIFSGLILDTTQGTPSGEICLNLFTRLFNCASSGFMGFIVGGQINDIDAEYINLKCLVHESFLNDTTFKPLSEQDLAKKEFAEFAKKENEKLMLSYEKD